MRSAAKVDEDHRDESAREPTRTGSSRQGRRGGPAASPGASPPGGQNRTSGPIAPATPALRQAARALVLTTEPGNVRPRLVTPPIHLPPKGAVMKTKTRVKAGFVVETWS